MKSYPLALFAFLILSSCESEKSIDEEILGCWKLENMTDSLGESMDLENEYLFIFKKDGYKILENGRNEQEADYRIYRAESSLLNEELDMIELDESGAGSIITIESDRMDLQGDCLNCGSALFIRHR